jgi:hypothetical protein
MLPRPAYNLERTITANHQQQYRENPNIQPTAAPVSGKKTPPSRCALLRCRDMMSR